MVKPKKKTQQQKEAAPQPVIEEEAESSDHSDPEADNEWMQKYMGDNQMMWFRKIIRAQATVVMKDIIAQEVNKIIGVRLSEQKKEMTFEIKKLCDRVDQLEVEVKKKARRIERLEFENSKKESTIKAIKVQMDEFQQQGYDKHLQIVGMSECSDGSDDTKQIVKLSKEKLGIKLRPSDLEEVTRLGKKSDFKTRNIVVKFKDKSLRDKLYDSRRKSITDPNPKKNIYINDRLTQHRQHLLYAARKLVKSKKLFVAWAQDGNILIRKREDSRILEVKDHTDLREFTTSQEEECQENSDSSINDNSMMSHLSDYEYYVDSDV